MIDLTNKQIIYFDGICNLCANTVQFVLKRNKKKNILFASLQSAAGQEMLEHFGLSGGQFDSFVFIDNGKLYKKSLAALKVTTYLNYGWPLLYSMIIIPAIIRDALYDWVARNRYRWFGQKSECWLPSADYKDRFLN